MPGERVCPKCSKPLPTDSPLGLCPECLLKAAFLTQSTVPASAEDLKNGEAAESATINPAAGMRVKYFGDYELVDEIARGGMGVVWKARQNSLNRTVAIKMILAGKLAGSVEVQRFLREAEAAANLQHPNIVAIHEVGEHDGQHYFSMDYVEGRDLGSLVRAGAMQPQRAARYVKTIALAIHFAHQRGTLHRDLKPQNVLIDASDQPRITDFGLAKFLEDDSGLTHTGAVMGSPSYMSPEQASGRIDQVGPASDVYALGAILYELVTGRPPFREGTAMATLRKVMEADPTPPRKVNVNVPLDLETICLKCLEKSPQQRYHSARDLADDLQRFLDREPILARPVSPLRKVISWTRRHPMTLAAVGTLILIGLGVFTFKLIEENAFLRAQHANPALSRQPGALTAALDDLNSFSLIVFGIAMFSHMAIRRRSMGVRWKELFDPIKAVQPLKPLSGSSRLWAIGVGLGSVGYGKFFLARIIQAYVWEGDVRSVYLLGVWVDVWFGLMLLWLVVRDYQRTWFGAPSRELSPETIAEIRKTILESDAPQAIRIYRKAVPEASLAEARDYVNQLMADIQSKEPGKLMPPRFSLRTLNWSLIGFCALIEVIVVGLLTLVYSPMQTTAGLWQFIAGVAFGIGILMGPRLDAIWKRVLVLLPGILLVTVGSAPMRQAGTPYFFTWCYMIGIICGSFLLISGYTKNRRRSVQPESTNA